MTPFQAAKTAAKALLTFLGMPRAEATPVATVARALVDSNGTVCAQGRSLVLTAAKTLDVSESGSTFYLNLAGGFTLTLPTPALGLKFDFVVKTAPTTAYIITNHLGTSGDNIVGHVLSSSGGAEDAETTAGGDVVNFVANTAVAGDRLTLESDGTYWYATARCAAAGGITITG